MPGYIYPPGSAQSTPKTCKGGFGNTNRRIVRHHLPCGVSLHGGRCLVGCWLTSVHGSCWLAIWIHLTGHSTIHIVDALLSAIIDRGTMTLDRRLLAVVTIIPGRRWITSIARRWRNLHRLTLRRSSRDWLMELVRSCGSFPAVVNYAALHSHGFIARTTWSEAPSECATSHLDPRMTGKGGLTPSFRGSSWEGRLQACQNPTMPAL